MQSKLHNFGEILYKTIIITSSPIILNWMYWIYLRIFYNFKRVQIVILSNQILREPYTDTARASEQDLTSILAVQLFIYVETIERYVNL